MQIGSNWNFSGNQAQNISLHPVGTAPGSPSIAQIYTDTSGATHAVKMWLNVAGTPQWVTLSTSANSFTNPMTSVGDVMYGGTGGAATRLTGNTTTAKQFLGQVGDGTNSAAPVWGALSATDIPSLAASKITSGQGSLSEATSSVLTITGSNTLLGSTTILVKQANTTTSGYLSSGDWNTFNGKQTALTNPVTYTGTPSANQIASWNALGVIQGLAATGTGNAVLATTPTLVTPILGIATATSINKITLTQPATGSTLTIQDGLTLTVSGNANVSGTNSGDFTLDTNSGLASTGQTLLKLGTPSSITGSSTNSVTTNTHTHALSGVILQDGSTSFTAGTTNIASGATLNVQSGGNLTVASGATFQTSATPSNALDVVNKGYVDTLAQGTPIKPTARLATTGVLSPANNYTNGTAGVGATLSATGPGILTVDGIATVLNDIILVKDEASGLKNGLYTVTTQGTAGVAYVLTRSIGMDTSAEFSGGVIPVKTEGTDNKNTLWMCNNTSAPAVGTTAITFTQLNGATDLVQGTGITISGNTISLTSNTTTIGTTGIALGSSSTTLAGLTSVSSTGFTGALTGNASSATNTGITEDTTNASAVYPTWVTANTGNLPVKTTSTKLSFIPNTGILTATGFAGGGAGLTGLTAGNLSGTIPSTVLGNSTVYIGTTAVALNRASAGIALTGITSIAGTQFTGAVSLDASLGIAIADGAPGVTTNKIYNVGGALYFNGNTVGSVKKYTTTFTGAGPTFGPYTHGLGSALIQVSVWDHNGNLMMCDVTVTSTQITLSFGYGVPGANTYTMVAVG